MSTPSMMFPGSNLFGTGRPLLPPNSSTGPNVLPPNGINCQTRAILGQSVAPAASVASPSLFPSPLTMRPVPDFGSAPSLPFWPPPFLGFPSAPFGSKNGSTEFANWCNANAALLRPTLPPYWPPAVSAYQQSCIPKTGAVNLEPPSQKRHCNNSRQNSTTSPACSIALVTSGSCDSATEGVKCCPICTEVIPVSSSRHDFNRHLMNDAEQTEQQFNKLKRKLASTNGIVAAVASASVSPDPATTSRLETFRRVKENRMTRMREKLANVQLSRTSTTPVDRNIFGGSTLMMPISAASSGGQTDRRSVASRDSQSSSTTARSVSRSHGQSPDGDEIRKEPVDYSSSPSGASTSSKPIKKCGWCSDTDGPFKTCGACNQMACKNCWHNATEDEDNLVCPICSTGVNDDGTVIRLSKRF